MMQKRSHPLLTFLMRLRSVRVIHPLDMTRQPRDQKILAIGKATSAGVGADPQARILFRKWVLFRRMLYWDGS